MNWRSPHVISVVVLLLPLTFYGLWMVFWKVFGYVLHHHALRAESPYFLPACVACAAAPLVFGVFFGIYNTFYSRIRRRAERDADAALDTERIDRER